MTRETVLPPEMAGKLAEMYDIALATPDIAISRMRGESSHQVFYAWAKQIESAHGLFSDSLWVSINKPHTDKLTVSEMVRKEIEHAN